MVNPKLRFPGYTDEWQEHSVGSMTRELHEYNTLESGLPLMTSSRNGIMLQSDYRGSITTDSEDAQFSVVHRGDCTYRHMSDDDIFHFNINTIADAGLVSKEYPVFECVAGNSLPLLVEYLNSSKRFLKFCREQKMGGTRTRLYYSRLCEFSFPFPSVEEQEQIVDLFDRINETIANQEKYVSALETQKKELLRQVFAREIRFKDENGQDYPEWEERRLGEYVQIERGGSPRPIDAYITDDPDGLNWIKIGDAPAFGNHIIGTKQKIKKSGLKKTREVYPGDLILSNSMSFGKPYILDITGCIHDGWLVIRNTDNAFILEYLCVILGSSYMYDQYSRLAAGSAVTNLNKDLVANAHVYIPSIPEQRRIADFFTALDAQIENERALLEDWRQLKKGLLQQMFI